MYSIRSRITLIVFGIFIVGMVVISAALYDHTEHELAEVLDTGMGRVAGLILTLKHSEHTVTHNMASQILAEVDVGLHHYKRLLAYQVFHEGVLIFRSPGAPEEPFSIAPGFDLIQRDGVSWRVFTTAIDAADGMVVHVAEKVSLRQNLVMEITLGSLSTILPIALAVVFALYFGLGHGLRPLKRAANAVASRSSDNLSLLTLPETPSELLPLVDEINGLMSRLHATLERERQFTANAAHELRTPLSVLKIQSQVLLRPLSQEERQHVLKQMASGVDRATHLVSQLLTLARLDPLASSENMNTVHLEPLLEETLASLVPLATDRDIEIRLASKGASTVWGNVDALQILFSNLVRNALIYTPVGGQVQVKVESQQDALLVRVEDSGPGVPVEERQSVFNRFHRGVTASSNTEGCGLGLSIVKRIAELHGATLELNTASLGGLSVTVLFPRNVP
ncbi:MAG: sensor histidine kinase N-terminal domain-containing protein [Magnetococcales bacterium]|nr:sensor histidine kinase N-terminal domain-containing protein [Magnetococcales bacterium]